MWTTFHRCVIPFWVDLAIKAWKLVVCNSSLRNWNCYVTTYLYCSTAEAQFKAPRNDQMLSLQCPKKKRFRGDSRPRTKETRFLPCLLVLRQTSCHILLKNFWVHCFCYSQSLWHRHMLQLSDKPLFEWDQISRLRQTATAGPALLVSISEGASQVLHLDID